MSNTPIQQAKLRLPLPLLMRQLGLEGHSKKSTKCPFHGDKHNSFSVFKGEGGAWFWKCFSGCGKGDEVTFLEKHKGITTGEAIKLFLKMAGCAPVKTFHTSKKANGAFDWQACVDALIERDLERLGNERWYSRAFCSWLHENKLVGLHNGCVAFPVHDEAGMVVAAHYRNGSWAYHPSGIKTRPLIIGNISTAKQIHVFESQWDALALADRTDLYREKSVAFIATRGAPTLGWFMACYPKACPSVPGRRMTPLVRSGLPISAHTLACR